MDINIKDKDIIDVMELLNNSGIKYQISKDKEINNLNITKEFQDFIDDYPKTIQKTALYVFYVMKNIHDNYGDKYKIIRSYMKFYSEETGISRKTLMPIFEIMKHGGFLSVTSIPSINGNWNYSISTFRPFGEK